MFWSKNDFFKRDSVSLKADRIKVSIILTLKGYTSEEVVPYLRAYDYFVINPNEFDGATIVKDLDDIPGLDLDAMLHDYEYLVDNVARGFITKWKSDMRYLEGMARKGKGYRTGRFVLLTISGIVFVPYKRYFK